MTEIHNKNIKVYDGCQGLYFQFFLIIHCTHVRTEKVITLKQYDISFHDSFVDMILCCELKSSSQKKGT